MYSGDKREQFAVLPHEWCFGAYLALTWLRLFLAGGKAAAWSSLYLGLLLGSAIVIWWAAQSPSPRRWRIRLLFYPVAMGLSFFAMEFAMPLLSVHKVDGMLLAWDRILFHETPALAWANFGSPWLVDLSMAGYLFFFYYLVAGPARYFLRDLSLFRKCIVGLFTMYGIAFLGYLFFPAGGPHRFMTFSEPLHGGWLLQSTLHPVNAGSNGVDVFPSVHIAATLYLLVFDWWHSRRRFWWALVPCVILWFSTLYLRFHYLVDLFAGALVGLIAICVAYSFERSTFPLRGSHPGSLGELVSEAKTQRRNPLAVD